MPKVIEEIEIISQEFIKPSSPTPPHLRIFKFSLLDQLIPAPYAPIVLFYDPNNNNNGDERIDETAKNKKKNKKKLAVLKQSLSKTLSKFYPLAGIIRDDFSIECNDHGASYITAMVKNNHGLSEFLEKPDLHLICRFLPCDPTFMGSMAGKCVTNVQINLFECGGIAIALCISHKILDGNGLKFFLRNWAEMAAEDEDEEITSGDHGFVVESSLFPANDDLWLRDSSMAMWSSMFKKGKSSTKRFVFNATAITTLKAMAVINSGGKGRSPSPSPSRSDLRSPTRVEVTSAFLWKCVKTASESINGYKRSSMLTHVVNLRKRATPTLPENSIGNLIWISNAKSTKQNRGLSELADLIRHSISKIDGEYVKKLCDGNKGSALMRRTLKEIGDFRSNRFVEEEEKVDYLGFSSWCGFGFYEIDFGWGKPIWVSSYAPAGAPAVFMNLVILLETRNGDGIEAWVTLDEQEMEFLQHDHEILAFTSIDPSPLNV